MVKPAPVRRVGGTVAVGIPNQHGLMDHRGMIAWPEMMQVSNLVETVLSLTT